VDAPPVDIEGDMRAAARRIYRETQRGRQVSSPDGTTVRLTAAGEGKAFARSADMGARARIAAVLGDLIASAPIYGTEPDRGGRSGLTFANAAGAVRIDGEVRAVRLIYRVGEQSGAAFYELQGYEVADPARSGGARAGEGAPLAGQPLTGPTIKVGDLVDAFNGPVLFQSTPAAPRGSVTFPAGGLDRGETLIRLMEGADLSTFIHESGHFFLEAFRTLASDPAAPQALRDDLAVIHKFLGVEDGAAGYTVAQQEQWARGFEAYAMEGRAPSLELADAFSRFKAWLTRIYRTLRGLNVRLTDEVRGVMDRMLATDAEIATARALGGMGFGASSLKGEGLDVIAERAVEAGYLDGDPLPRRGRRQGAMGRRHPI
jgi:hypothetical protein